MNIRRLLLYAVLCSSAIAAAGPFDPRQPLPSANPHRRAPAWVPAERGVTPDGTLDPSHFQSYELDTLRRFQRRSPAVATADATATHCLDISEFDDFGVSQPEPTIAALRAAARGVHVGTVAEIIPGFYDGLPASIVRARTDSGTDFFVLYRAARFTVHGQSFCRTDRRYGELPAIGDDMLVFERQSVDRDRRVFAPLHYEVIVQPAGRAPRIPRELQQDEVFKASKSLRALASRIAQEQRERQ